VVGVWALCNLTKEEGPRSGRRFTIEEEIQFESKQVNYINLW
jgi:hypothetical protein